MRWHLRYTYAQSLSNGTVRRETEEEVRDFSSESAYLAWCDAMKRLEGDAGDPLVAFQSQQTNETPYDLRPALLRRTVEWDDVEC